jgi:hypothetical protein
VGTDCVLHVEAADHCGNQQSIDIDEIRRGAHYTMAPSSGAVSLSAGN